MDSPANRSPSDDRHTMMRSRSLWNASWTSIVVRFASRDSVEMQVLFSFSLRAVWASLMTVHGTSCTAASVAVAVVLCCIMAVT